MDTLIRSRAGLKSRVSLFEKYLNTILNKTDGISQTDTSEIRKRVGQHEQLLTAFYDIQSQIEAHNNDPEFIDEEERELFETRFYELLTRAEQITLMVNSDENTNSKNNSITSNKVGSKGFRLPRIQLPSFDGDYTKYKEFFDVFKALVDSNLDTSDAEKLCYLKMSVKGEAASLLASFETTDANYRVAFKLLSDRYDNPRLTIYNHVKKLLNLDIVVKESHTSLRNLIDTCEQNMRSLNSLGQPVEHWDAIIVPIITSKIDKETAKAWEIKINSNDKTNVPTYKELLEFLNLRQATLEAIEVKAMPTDVRPTTREQRTKRLTFHTIDQKNYICNICSEDHAIYKCKTFLKMNVHDRISKIKQNKLCNNCLKYGHFANTCKASGCKTCGGRHNTLLHFTTKKNTNEVTKQEVSCLFPEQNNKEGVDIVTLLSTAIVHITDKNGKEIEARALLDNGSTSCLMTQTFAEKLKIKQNNLNFPIIIGGVGKTQLVINTQVRAVAKSRTSDFKYTTNYLVIPQVTDKLPLKSFDINKFNIPRHMQLADPRAGVSSNIDILIGASIFWELLKGKSITLTGTHKVILTNTHLGWVLGGNMISSAYCNKHTTYVTLAQLQEDLQRFWKIDEIQNDNVLSSEESYCEKHFNETHYRNKKGEFVVRLPFKNLQDLGESRDIALKRFHYLESKLNKNPKFREKYVQFMKEYIELDHMRLVHANDTKFRVYLPHHGVINESSSTTKLRVVFDASCKTTTGVSLNDVLNVGPVIQRDLFTILNNFRMFPYVTTSDIEKMYRMVRMHEDDRKYQSILWRDNPNKEVQTYELCTVTYGTASASYLATKALAKLSESCKQTNPEESEIIKNYFYVDDLIFGSETINELKQRQSALKNILKSAGFNLRKWRSNVAELNQIDGDQEFNQITSKTLGILWEPCNDIIKYTVEEIQERKYTKRLILMETAKLFDPFGLLAPTTIIPKIIIQELWSSKVDWDEEISEHISSKWKEFRRNLKDIEQIRISRYILINNKKRVELHGFSDASEAAYGACIYIRSLDVEDNVKVDLLVAKSKVAPIKKLSIPRLELNAALLLARLVEKIRTGLDIVIDSEHMWCDSNIVLAWIQAEPNKWATYVANRVSEIRNKTSYNCWKHVKTLENPADLISRGLMPGKLKDSQMWWHGPHWLGSNQINFPETNLPSVVEIPERRILITIHNEVNDIFQRYSNLNRLINIITYCYRFKTKLKGVITLTERQESLSKIIRLIQKIHFHKEMADLKANRNLSKDSSLIFLNPFLDDQGLLRVGGRLAHANIPYETKHQIILPESNHITKLIFTQCHIDSLHCGPQQLVANVRQRYWPIRAKNIAKLIFHKCVQCFRANPKRNCTIMGNLPAERVIPSTPFTNCGVDYAGPITIKESRLRKPRLFKAYIALFVCFSTKAVHIEAVTELSIEGFLAALHRFVSRRGKPAIIHSDNGTNFVGADRILKTLVSSDDVVKSLANNGIEWKFIPARSPHMGGIWEGNIKIVKTHLKRVLGNTILTLDGFITILTRIESMLNSRPLTPLTNDPTDLEPLTPGHFLILKPLNALPTYNNCLPLNKFKELNSISVMVEHIWKRWKNEYLHQLQTRYKWLRKGKEPKLGELVILVDENTHPLKWPLGRVIDIHKGIDGVVRVVTVKTANGTSKRAIHKICYLPVLEDSKVGGMDNHG